ncbi:MAG: HlyC/CorC family transporter [Clostridiales bacterium]|nr:HlyC/CorC family transporter [Clostridiales bacterium]
MDDPGPGSIILSFLSAAQPAAQATDYGSLAYQIPLLVFLVLVNAFFAMSEIAIISLNDNKIEKMAEDGHKKAKQVMKLTANSSNFLSTIQIGVTLAGFLTSASAATSFADMLTKSLDAVMPDAIPRGLIQGASVVLITLIISFFSLVLGELAPKRIAMQIPEKVSFKVVGVLLFFAKFFKPLVKILSLSTNGVVRLFGFDPNADQESVTEEEIRMMVDVGEEKGVIENTQKEMINNIFEFNDIDAGDIMTHRTDMAAVDAEDSFDEVMEIAINEGFSRIPVYEEDPDNIVGIIYVKDLLKYVGKKMPANGGLRDLMREAYYVPETKPCGELFSEMSSNRIQMAVVVDEYGGTAGILTLEDLVEAIVGNIQDEYDNEDEEISKIDDNTFTVDGVIGIDEINELTGTELPDGDYDTLGGFIISRLHYIPQDGEMNVIEFENITFTVLNVEERRIGRVRVEITPHDTQENGADGEEE